MKRKGVWWFIGCLPLWAGGMPEKAAKYHAELAQRPESAVLFQRFRDAWLEERPAEELDAELGARADAGEPAAWAILARERLAADRGDEALAAFAKAREASPAAWIDMEMARLHLAAGAFPDAEKHALAVPADDKLRAEALKIAGLACLREERVDEATGHWQSAVETAPGDARLLEELTELTRREGRFDLAIGFCESWREATPDAYGKAMATLAMSELQLASSRFDEATESLRQALGMSGDGSWLERETLVHAQQAFRGRSDTTGHANWLAARAVEFPNRIGLLRARVRALADSGKPADALEVLAEILRRSPGDKEARWQRVDLLERSLDLAKAIDECRALAAEEPSETAGLRLAGLAFRLDRGDEVKRALQSVIDAADPAKRIAHAALFSRYGMPAETERVLKEAADGEHAGIALRELAKFYQQEDRGGQALETWKQLGDRDIAADKIDAARMLAAAGGLEKARAILDEGRPRHSNALGYEAARAELALMAGDSATAAAIHLAIARAAKRPDELAPAIQGWLRATRGEENPAAALGDATADRCLRAAWLAANGRELPPVSADDELERSARLTLLREHGMWDAVIAMMDASPDGRGPLFLSDLAEVKALAGDLQGALAAARMWKERSAGQAGPWLREADLLEKLGDTTGAGRILRRAAARFDDNEDVAKRLFSLLHAGGTRREAIGWAWKRHDRSADAAVRAGWLREIIRISKETGGLAELRAGFEERARRDPASPGPLLALADLAAARDESREELGFLRRAAAAAPRDPDVLTRLARSEERGGESTAALERYKELARLVPGRDSARELAAAKIRLGDIEGGVRDLQALAGEKGLDLRKLEQSAGDLATRGFIDEAIRLLAAVAPAERDVRHEFLLGILSAIDGREIETIGSLAKVLAEPDEDDGQSRSQSQDETGYHVQTLVYQLSNRDNLTPGELRNLGIPGSLREAKAAAKSKLLRIALDGDGAFWDRVVAVLPDLAAGTHAHWRAVLRFQNRTSSYAPRTWMDALENDPDNPIIQRLAIETRSADSLTKEKAAAWLQKDLPLPAAIRISLWQRAGRRADEILTSLESLDERDLDTPEAASAAFQAVRLALGGNPNELTPERTAHGIAILEKLRLPNSQMAQLEPLRFLHALYSGNIEDAADRADRLSITSADSSMSPHSSWDPIGLSTSIVRWREKADAETYDTFVSRIESPVLRLQLALQHGQIKPDPKDALDMIDRELAALDTDAPASVRRALLMMRWTYLGNDGLDAELRTLADDDADPALAFHALLRIHWGENNAVKLPGDSRRMELLTERLSRSQNVGDQQLARTFGRHIDRSSPHRTAPPSPTKWGVQASFYPRSGRRWTSAALATMADRDLAVREAASLLEERARAGAGSYDLGETVDALKESGLLEPALARIGINAGSGLCARLALLRLMDVCGETERSHEILTAIATARPWETRWPVELALRSDDPDEFRHLLDGAAEHDDFDEILPRLLGTIQRDAKARMEIFDRLADWAPTAKGSRGWIFTLMQALAHGNNAGLDTLRKDDEARTATLRRYFDLALTDPQRADTAFRIWNSTKVVQEPAELSDLARRALLAAGLPYATPPTESERNVSGDTALEFLCGLASTQGDETAFPPAFRKQLAKSQPDASAWLESLLSARSTADLTDLETPPSNDRAAVARFWCAVLRAADMPDRDEWVLRVFREKKHHGMGTRFHIALRRSLATAKDGTAVRKRVESWLEASKPEKDEDVWQGTSAPTCIAKAAMEMDAPTALAVLAVFRETKSPVEYSHGFFSPIGIRWADELAKRKSARIADLPQDQLGLPLKTGCWTSRGGVKEPVWIWGFPEAVRAASQRLRDANGRNPTAAPVENTFVDLMQRFSNLPNPHSNRSALLTAMPELRKLPADFRNAVIDHLTSSLTEDSIAGLPAPAAERLRARLDRDREQRLADARKRFEALKTAPHSFVGRSDDVGNLVAGVLLEEPAFADEVIAAWKPTADADRSGRELQQFLRGLANNSGSLASLFARLRVIESLGGQALQPPKSGMPDPLERFLDDLRHHNGSAEFWRGLAETSPAFQARICVAMLSPYVSLIRDADEETAATLREAAKGTSPAARGTLEWILVLSTRRGSDDKKLDAAQLVRVLHQLKDAGAPAHKVVKIFAASLSDSYLFDTIDPFVSETSSLLEDVRLLHPDDAQNIIQAIDRTLYRLQNRKPGKADDDNPGSSADLDGLLRSVIPRVPPDTRLGSCFYITRHLISSDDTALFDAWLKLHRKALIGADEVILALLRMDRIEEAISFAPAEGRELNRWSGKSFGKEMETTVEKLAAAPSPEAFALRVRFCTLHDEHGDEAPSEPRETRIGRLEKEFDERRAGLSLGDRILLVRLLGLTQTALTRHVPALDEFAGESHLQALATHLSGGDRSDAAWIVFRAACSRLHAGDASLLQRIADLITAVPRTKTARTRSGDVQGIDTILPGVIHHAIQHDGRLPDASARAARAYAMAITNRGDQMNEICASLLLRVIDRDDTAFAKSLEAAGIPSMTTERVLPVVTPATARLLFQLGIGEEPPAPEDLRAKIRDQTSPRTVDRSHILPRLADPELRRNLKPEEVVQAVRGISFPSPDEIALIRAYIAEHREELEGDSRGFDLRSIESFLRMWESRNQRLEMRRPPPGR
ncbi:MAG: hypothetical protein H7A48_08435 [Akkermansiaceae bacterium]|nr:hypothetical protein [Akkermansiaceae bacterium]